MSRSQQVVREQELAALVALDRSRPRGVASWRLARHVEEVGSAVEAAADPPLGISLQDSAVEIAAADVSRWAAAGVDIRSVLDHNYPGNLRGAFDAPPLLYIRGELEDEWARKAIAVVGTRNVSEDGRKHAAHVTRALVRHGYAVLSGLARGVDKVAHETAVAEGGRTVAVIGTGIGKVYPAEHDQLADEIVAHRGSLVSQFEPGTTAARHHFPMRNATMSGLALATVVVEAGATSGSKTQAVAALRHGKRVFLLRSVVEQQPWARELVELGKFGARAIPVGDLETLLAALQGDSEAAEPLAFA